MTRAGLLHIAECVFLFLLAGLAVYRLSPAVIAHPQVGVFLFAELLDVALIVLQRPGEVSVGIRPILVGFGGTVTALLIVPNGVQLAPNVVSTVLIFSGLVLSIFAKFSLRRSFGLVAANRGVKSGGLYRLVRHPMYMGYMINHVGFLLLYLSPWNVAIYALTWILLWMRTEEEEKVLRRDPGYRDYAERVRSRLVPGVI